MSSNPERRAWRILVIAFAIFIVICALAAYVTQWFVFRSMVELQVSLKTARGTVQVTSPTTGDAIAVTDRRDNLELNTLLQTDSTSQALVTFSDTRTGEVIATMVLHRDSQVSITQAAAPRYGANRSPYSITVEGAAGRCETLILEQADRPLRVQVKTTHALVRADSPGQFIVDTIGEWTTVSVRSGTVEVLSLSGSTPIALDSGKRVVVGQDNEQPEIEPTARSIVSDGLFEQISGAGWTFYNDAETDPPGSIYNAVIDRRPVVVFDRSQENWPGIRLGHGETGLVQSIEMDVSDYPTLELRATFYVDEQSLSTCGQRGSECPMMFRIDYTDVQGGERSYITGFYALHDPAAAYPLACDTCRTDHERINPDSWYTFESGNLMERLPADLRPAYIREIKVYASGHAYKVYLSEIELLVSE
ncbi:MAG: hypothetical protein Kow00124_22740 [Anaerolineae bacterium]